MNYRLPGWFKQEIIDNNFKKSSELISSFGLNTVCKEALCPNINECFKKSKLTFLILGDTCTRKCLFCAVKHSFSLSLPQEDEPKRIAEAVSNLKLEYVVITSVTRDDLPDGGARHFAKTIEYISSLNKNVKIEVLIPDFKARTENLQIVVLASPDVIGHNLETVKRLHKILKPQSDYLVSLEVLEKIKNINPAITTKSSLLLGLGESEEEVISAMRDLRKVDCDVLTLGQYLSCGKNYFPVKEYIYPEKFEDYQKEALSLGFRAVLSGPLVRSSYKAEEIYQSLAPKLISS